MIKYRYLHILWYDDVKFYKNMVEMFNIEKEWFRMEDHLFITPFDSVYNNLKEYKNVKKVSEKNMLRIYGKQAEWIFLHPLSLKRRQVIRIPKKIARKIIWRTWGHDIRPVEYKQGQVLKNVVKWILDKLYKHKILQFRAIGIANDIDKMNVQNEFGDKIDTKIISYGYRDGQYQKLKLIKDKMSKSSDTIKIMVGHNGAPADRHIEVLKKLEKYKDEDILISLPLSYGDPKYILEVKEYALKTFDKNKIEFIEEFVPFLEFAKYIAQIDVAIMDNYYSNGLGNLSLLIFFEKKLYINANGNIAQSFKNNYIDANYTGHIDVEEYTEFCKEKFDSKEKQYIKYSSVAPKEMVCDKWKEVLYELDCN